MSAYGGPQIVSDGMIFFLDSSNPKSYPGAGTVWTDMSGFSNNITLINNVGFSTINAGSLVFNGTNNYAEGTNSASLDASTSMTVSAWIRITNFSGLMSIVGKGSTSPAGGWDFRLDGNTQLNLVKYAITDQKVTINALSANVWQNLCAVQGPANVTYYVNGSGVGIFNNSSSFVASTANLRVARDRDITYTPSNIGQIMIYNRTLSALEIQQNFNALRGKYGI